MQFQEEERHKEDEVWLECLAVSQQLVAVVGQSEEVHKVQISDSSCNQ